MSPAVRRYRTRILLVYAAVSTVVLIVLNSVGLSFDHADVLPVDPLFTGPFILLLLAIAAGPFINKPWWDAYYPAVSLSLGAVTISYYLVVLENGNHILATGYEYFSFISLIGSLYVVSGGIFLRVKGKATPFENLGILSLGALLANVLGTTGASMVLIRPYLRINRYRIRPYHVVFFIFAVSNIGGALTPIGDPPLFLGYLKGIPFFWIADRVIGVWALTLGMILAMFFVIDTLAFQKVPEELRRQALEADETQVGGVHNVVFLLVIVGAVFLEHPAPAGLREVIMWGAAVGSYLSTSREVHHWNAFSFQPVKEVAILFLGIFATMMPALDWMELNAGSLGINTVGEYFWGTGILSSVLDNAPTYLNFLSASFGLHGASLKNALHMKAMIDIASPEALGLVTPLVPGAKAITSETWRYVQAVSLGAVFFGAMTYIGNGPNFMVKSIAERSGIAVPSFVGYLVRYSLPVLVPVFLVVWYLFFRV